MMMLSRSPRMNGKLTHWLELFAGAVMSLQIDIGMNIFFSFLGAKSAILLEHCRRGCSNEIELHGGDHYPLFFRCHCLFPSDIACIKRSNANQC